MNIITDKIPPETHDQWIGLDIEMSNLNPYQLHRPNSGKFELMSVAIGEDVYMIDTEEKITPTLQNINDNWWIFQNAKFDITHLRRWANISPRNRLWDTMIMEQILFGGYYNTFALDDLVRRHLHMHMDKELQKSFDGGELSHEQITYSARDAYVLPKIVKCQKKLTTKDDFNIWMNIDLPALWAFMDFRGFAIDAEKWRNLAIRNKRRQEQIDAELPINPRSYKDVGKYLRENGFKKLKSTNEKDLRSAISQYPDTHAANIAQMVLDSRMYSKRASTYGVDLLDKFLEQEDGIDVIHCNYWLIGAETGRTSSDNPNMQNIPARETSEFRECFIARPGNKLIVADYSAQEVFVAAYQSQDPKLIAICNSDEDVYVASAREILEKEITKKDPLRNDMKPLVLGANYGMSKYGVSKKLGCSVEEAEEIILRRMKAFPRLQEYLDAQSKTKNKVKTPAGRTIHLNHYSSQSERNALNGPIQGGAADCAKQSLANLHASWNEVFPIKFSCVEFTHDELGLDVPEEYVKDVAEHTEKVLIETANKMFPGLQFKADAHIGTNWANAK